MYEKLINKLSGLVIFDNLRHDPAISSLADFFKFSDTGDTASASKAYADFARAMIISGGDISEHIMHLISTDDNIFVRKYFGGDTGTLESQLRYELEFLYELSHSIPAKPIDGVRFPDIKASHIYYRDEYPKMLPDISKRGMGIWAKSAMFRIDGDGGFIPVDTDKTVRLSELVGYERERRRIIDNTKALLEGHAAANALLYGDAGTGKSTTVKAVAMEYASEGLRLIELDKSRVALIPEILKKIAGEPLKFIIFIDDLTLSPDSGELSVLKTVLEGGAGTDRSNSVIYVTSNHRHLVKENAADRAGEVNVRDNIESIHGLSARFALSVTFLSPDRELYLSIVRELAEKHGIEVTDALLSKAEAFSVRRNGRTPRCAKQFVELTLSGVDPIK